MVAGCLAVAGCGGGGGAPVDTGGTDTTADTGLADRQKEQRDALSDASTALAAALTAIEAKGDGSTVEQFRAAVAALADLETAIAGAADLTAAQKERYRQEVRLAKGRDLEERHFAAIVRDIRAAEIEAAMDAVALVTDTSDDSTVTAAEAAVAAARTAIGAADIPDLKRQELLTALAKHEGGLDERKTSRAKAMEAQGIARGKAMFGALRGPKDSAVVPRTNTALNNVESTPGFDLAVDVPVPDALEVNAAPGAGSLAPSVDARDLELVKGDPGGTVKGWNYRDYTHTAEATGTNRARVYTSRTASERKPLKDHFGDSSTRPSRAGTYTAATRTVQLDAGQHHGIKSTEFPRAASKVFRDIHGEGSQVRVRGTYDGAPGEYRCTTTPGGNGERCGASWQPRRPGKEAGVALSAGWNFVHDEGAMVDVHDDDYYYFGWWVREDDGMPVAASAFWNVRGIGHTAAGGTTGSATYGGLAAGLYGVMPLPDREADGGDFTADVELVAVFGGSSSAGLTGTVDNFRLDGGDTDPGWSVALEKTGWAGSGLTNADAKNTSWTVGGVKAPKSGNWRARAFNDQSRKGSTVPTDMLGSFYTEFGTTHRMAGAFGATLQEPQEE